MMPAPPFRTGQISVEYVLVMALMLLVLIMLVALFTGIYSQQAGRAQYLQAQEAVSILSSTARGLWAEGNGSSARVSVLLPPITQLSNSSFSDHTIGLYLNGYGDVTTAVPFFINGTWPAQTGTFHAQLSNNGTHILIRPAGGLSANASGVYLSFSSGGQATTTLWIRNRANASYAILHTLACPPGTGCTYNGSSKTLAPEGWQQADLTITSSTAGLHAGRLVINGTPDADSGLANEQIILPLSVRVD